MRLTVLLPHEVFIDEDGVSAIRGEAGNGAFGMLEHHADFVTALRPGIFTFTSPRGQAYLALDEGILVKTGPRVRVSSRNAAAGAGLGTLREAVEKKFLALDETGRKVRSSLAKLEAGFTRKVAGMNNE